MTFQSATLTFDGELTIDLGHRVVELKFLGRGNTAGDAVAYLPREKIVITGDLVVSPIPYFSDGYPREWIQTLSRVAALDAAVVVPGHGLVMRDKQRILLIRDLLQSVVDQLDARLVKIGPAMSRTMDEVRDGVDVSAFRQRFAGHDRALGEAFDQAMEDLVNLALREASLR